MIAASAGAIMTRAYPNISGARMLRWFYVDKKEKRKHTSIVVSMSTLNAKNILEV